MRNKLLAMAFAAALASVFVAQSALAVEAEFQITPRGGAGDLDIKRFRAPNNSVVDADTLAMGCGFAFLTPIGIVAETGFDFGIEPDFFGAFDTYSMSQQFIAVGYQFELGNGWRFVPKVGRAKWTLESQEGALFNPGPEEVDEIKGYDNYWEVGVSRRISDIVALGVNFKQGDYRFGRSNSTAFIVTLAF